MRIQNKQNMTLILKSHRAWTRLTMLQLQFHHTNTTMDNHYTESMTNAGERAEILNIIRDGCEVLIRE